MPPPPQKKKKKKKKMQKIPNVEIRAKSDEFRAEFGYNSDKFGQPFFFSLLACQNMLSGVSFGVNIE